MGQSDWEISIKANFHIPVWYTHTHTPPPLAMTEVGWLGLG